MITFTYDEKIKTLGRSIQASNRPRWCLDLLNTQARYLEDPDFLLDLDGLRLSILFLLSAVLDLDGLRVSIVSY